MINDLFGGTMRQIEASLSVRAMRQDLIAANVANAETPGYRALDVNFAATMENVVAEMERSDAPPQPALAPAGAPRAPQSFQDLIVVQGDDSTTIGNSQNTVNVDSQLAHLDENRLMFQATAQLASLRFQGLKNIIEEGGRRQ